MPWYPSIWYLSSVQWLTTQKRKMVFPAFYRWEAGTQGCGGCLCSGNAWSTGCHHIRTVPLGLSCECWCAAAGARQLWWVAVAVVGGGIPGRFSGRSHPGHSQRICELFRPECTGNDTDLGTSLELCYNVIIFQCSRVYWPLALHVTLFRFLFVAQFGGNIEWSQGNKNTYPSKSHVFFHALAPGTLGVSSLMNEQQGFFFCLFSSRNNQQWTLQLSGVVKANGTPGSHAK